MEFDKIQSRYKTKKHEVFVPRSYNIISTLLNSWTYFTPALLLIRKHLVYYRYITDELYVDLLGHLHGRSEKAYYDK